MGVDGPRGGAARGRGGLTSPFRTERVEIPSALPAEELTHRLDARSGGWRPYRTGMAIRRDGDGYRLAVRRLCGSDVPRAFVRVVPEGNGARITGVIRPARWDAFVRAFGGLVGAVGLFSVVAESPGRVVLMIVGLVVVGQLVLRRQVEGQRERLRAYLTELAR